MLPEGLALMKADVALVWYCAVGTWTQAGFPVSDVLASSTHPKYELGQEMFTAPFVAVIVRRGGASGICDRISAL